jgi:hypothetical protein
MKRSVPVAVAVLGPILIAALPGETQAAASAGPGYTASPVMQQRGLAPEAVYGRSTTPVTVRFQPEAVLTYWRGEVRTALSMEDVPVMTPDTPADGRVIDCRDVILLPAGKTSEESKDG